MGAAAGSRLGRSVALAILFLISALVGLPALAQSRVVRATLVEDTFVDSSTPATVQSGSPSIRCRSASTLTRGLLLQYDLPVLQPSETCTRCSLQLSYLDAYGTWTTNHLGYASFTPNLTALTWSIALTNGLITGITANKTIDWGPSVTLWPELLVTPGKLGSPPSLGGYTTNVFTDASDGILQFLNSQLSTSQAQRITLCLGPHQMNNLSDWYSRNKSATNAPILELTLTRPSRHKGAVICIR